METKCCSKCETEKDISNFNFRKDTNKYRNICKECLYIQRKKYREDNKEIVRERKRKYALENKEKISEKQKIYRQENRERLNKYKYEWSQKNKESRRKSCKKYTENNMEKIRERNREYGKTEKGRKVRRASWHNRQKKKRNAGGSFTGEQILSMMEMQKNMCVYCRKDIKDSYHIDHIQPIAKGGNNYIENIQLLCPSCNLKKSSKDPFEFALERGRLV